MTTRAYWLIRYSGFVVVGIMALINPPHQPHQQFDRVTQIACFSAAGLALLAWLLVDELPRYRSRGLPIALGVLAAAAGLAGVTAGGGQSLVAFAAVAAVAAGAVLVWPAAAAVAAAGILPIWIVGPLVGSNLGTLAGYPLLIVATLSLGRNRRFYRVQAEQSAAWLAQYERLRAEQRRADVLDERSRIAREIHDVLAHSLGALGIQIQMARAMITDLGDTEAALDALSAAQRMASEGLVETRRAVHALRVDTLPLHEELTKAAAEHAERLQVLVHCDIEGEPQHVPPDATIALLRTAQESLVNAAKHAPGAEVELHLLYAADHVRMAIANDLHSADDAEPGAESGAPRLQTIDGGYGLTGMRERLKLLRGTLEAGPVGNRWIVTADLPLTRV